MFAGSSGFGIRMAENPRLITNGPYRFVRHPMYLAVILVEFGGLLIYRNWAVLIFAVMMFGLLRRARREEQALAELLGEQWLDYTRRVPAWLPRYSREG
jgi:protein-S-isoprenylcysteine O-methyltransferase Ste14